MMYSGCRGHACNQRTRLEVASEVLVVASAITAALLPFLLAIVPEANALSDRTF